MDQFQPGLTVHVTQSQMDIGDDPITDLNDSIWMGMFCCSN